MSDLAMWKVTINGSGTSPAINLDGMMLISVRCPASIAGANMTILACPEEEGTYLTVYKDGANVSKAIAASKCVMDFIDAKIISNWIKLVSDQTETAKVFEVVAMPL